MYVVCRQTAIGGAGTSVCKATQPTTAATKQPTAIASQTKQPSLNRAGSVIVGDASLVLKTFPLQIGVGRMFAGERYRDR